MFDDHDIYEINPFCWAKVFRTRPVIEEESLIEILDATATSTDLLSPVRLHEALWQFSDFFFLEHIKPLVYHSDRFQELRSCVFIARLAALY